MTSMASQQQLNPKSSAQEASRLTRDDWLDEAFKAVVEGGFDNVKVLSLAEKLKVTRGSFYWHFTDHADLINSLLMRWKVAQLALDAKLKLQQSGDALKDLDLVVDAAFLQAGSELENLRFEQAMRALSHHNAVAAQLLVEVDANRMDLFQSKFLVLVKDASKARDLAALLYLSIAGGFQALSRPANPPNIRAYFRTLISHYLVAKQVDR
ncbi:MAG: TetR/AcrR family transcriptional regulator [Betaproteobacteria bacterium]|nr:TetR/AcrR family transcriptional regulator [Betaproteobacteria bacterium]NBZ99927.1 TetR/AcrR family transcriptional regulator [Betaproteobacteria bacterium]NDB44895.1 TetR/AcrR family transcriptional regulator [Betaproteobacteria bacterium]NDD01077.1 TetR/AcrR family transcriptional regulator [Betaproteobacteria bacterium]NDD24152.1 TetR/AcrR family transcriptional regulator [Betaproteobacteria bacterium]